MSVADPDSLWNRRLENWAMWCVGAGGGSSGVSSVWTMKGHSSGRGDNDLRVVLVGEAMDTDTLVRKLARELMHAVHAWYLMSGTMGQKAHALAVDPDTLRRRVDAAHERLDELQRMRQAAQQRTQNEKHSFGNA